MASWEILAAMLAGEALFGVPGLVTAPLLYPFFKREIGRLWKAQQLPAPAQVIPPARDGLATRTSSKPKVPLETIERP